MSPRVATSMTAQLKSRFQTSEWKTSTACICLRTIINMNDDVSLSACVCVSSFCVEAAERLTNQEDVSCGWHKTWNASLSGFLRVYVCVCHQHLARSYFGTDKMGTLRREFHTQDRLFLSFFSNPSPASDALSPFLSFSRPSCVAALSWPLTYRFLDPV